MADWAYKVEVGPDERLVVWRGGKVHRVEGPGVALKLPYFEHATRVSVKPVRFEATAHAEARGGVAVEAAMKVEYGVLQPERAAPYVRQAGLGAAVEGLVDAAFRQALGETEADRLREPRDVQHLGRAAKKLANETALTWGVDVTTVEITRLAVGGSAEPAIGTTEPIPDACDVLLRAIGPDPGEVAKVLRRFTGWDQLHTRAVLEQVPTALLHRVPRPDAEEIERLLKAAGADVTLA